VERAEEKRHESLRLLSDETYRVGDGTSVTARRTHDNIRVGLRAAFHVDSVLGGRNPSCKKHLSVSRQTVIPSCELSSYSRIVTPTRQRRPKTLLAVIGCPFWKKRTLTARSRAYSSYSRILRSRAPGKTNDESIANVPQLFLRGGFEKVETPAQAHRAPPTEVRTKQRYPSRRMDLGRKRAPGKM
jgi:hypothetical protein